MTKAVGRPPRRAREILKLFLAHPQMADNLEGIAGWRLLERIVRTRVTDTESALSWLVAEGYLDRSSGAAAPPVYRLNPGRLADARRLVGSQAHSTRGTAKRQRRM